MKLAAILLVSLLATFALVGCSGDDNKQPQPTSPRSTRVANATVAATQTPQPQPTFTPQPPSGSITVFAAASLTAAFEEIKAAFEDENVGASVTYNFAGSPALRTQLQEGAKADIYASADTANMQQALDAGLVIDTGQIFAKNRLALIVPKANPAGITGLVDLGNGGVKLVLAGPDVPVGTYARQSVDKMQADGSFGEDFTNRVLANVVSEEPNVKAVVAKVQLGEADAGIVYVTDVTPEIADDVTLIEIPDVFNVIANYPIAVTSTTGDMDGAEAFIAFVLSEAGQAILADYGFLPVE